MLAIHVPIVEGTAISFEAEPPVLEGEVHPERAMRRRVGQDQRRPHAVLRRLLEQLAGDDPQARHGRDDHAWGARSR